MNCPECGREMKEGRAYCSNPACGALPGRAEAGKSGGGNAGKGIAGGRRLNFVDLARLAAGLIAALAFAYLYFSGKAGR